jgi:hypothetical protein
MGVGNTALAILRTAISDMVFSFKKNWQER